jgi:hypothetical protein
MAIAVDNSIINSAGSGTSTTVSFTVSGSERLFLSGGQDRLATTTCITSITYNGVGLSLVGGIQRSGSERFTTLYYLLNPSTGANNYTINKSVNTYHGHWGVSYTGVKQTGNPKTSGTKNSGTSSTTYNHALTLGAGNQRMMGIVTESTGSRASTDTVADTAVDNGFTMFAHSSNPISSGTFTTNYTATNTQWASVMSAWEEEPTATSNGFQLWWA